MAGPNQRSIRKALVPAGEAQTLYQPDLLAKEIRNLVRTTEGTLRSVRGPCTFEPERVGKSRPISGNVYGIWTGSLIGIDKTILVRVGNKLKRVAGWSRDLEDLYSGLTNETFGRFPDRFVQIGNKVVWTNGIDRPLVTTHDGMTVPLGFNTIPAPPQVQGPEQASTGTGGYSGFQASYFYPNAFGFSWPGRIGTIGDESEGQSGVVLAGEWLYYLMPEDIHGNLGPASPASAPARINTAKADPYDAESNDNYAEHGFELDDLTKQFRVIGGGDHTDEHCVAWWLFRTPDARNKGMTPQLVGRFPGRRKLNFDDALSDSELGSVMLDLVPVPLFKCACVHQGRLIIGNMTGDPGMVRRSVPGFPGMFERPDYLYPDGGGAEVTGMASHGGRLLVFTEHAVYDCSDFTLPIALADGIGCVAPSSIAAHPSGLLIWLSRDGFYGLAPGGQPQKLSALIDDTIYRGVNRSRMALAVADIHPESGEYICFLSPAGSSRNTLGLAFDGAGWRRYELGIDVSGVARDKGDEQYLLMLGKDRSQNVTSIFVFDHETVDYTPSKSSVLYKSANLYGDEIGLHEWHVHELFIGLVDSDDGAATIRTYRNGESTADSTQIFRLMGPDGMSPDTTSTIYADVASRATVGTSRVHDRRLTWRRIPVNMRRVTSWRFEIEVTYPTEIEIVAFAFTISPATGGHILSDLPGKDDA